MQLSESSVGYISAIVGWQKIIIKMTVGRALSVSRGIKAWSPCMHAACTLGVVASTNGREGVPLVRAYFLGNTPPSPQDLDFLLLGHHASRLPVMFLFAPDTVFGGLFLLLGAVVHRKRRVLVPMSRHN